MKTTLPEVRELGSPETMYEWLIVLAVILGGVYCTDLLDYLLSYLSSGVESLDRQRKDSTRGFERYGNDSSGVTLG